MICWYNVLCTRIGSRLWIILDFEALIGRQKVVMKTRKMMKKMRMTSLSSIHSHLLHEFIRRCKSRSGGSGSAEIGESDAEDDERSQVSETASHSPNSKTPNAQSAKAKTQSQSTQQRGSNQRASSSSGMKSRGARDVDESNFLGGEQTCTF